MAEEAGEWTLSIADTGIGLTADELAQVFEAFAQGEHARRLGSHRFGGLGLGLAISRTLVEMHAGSIGARSRGRDAGLGFHGHAAAFRAPGSPAEPGRAPGAAPPAPASPAAGRRLRILLVEDHAATRATLANLLGSRDYAVAATDSVAAARAAAAQEEFDLIISDLGLPDGGGCELLEELRAAQPGLPGIALSGYGMDEDVARSRRAGFAEHLIKPVGFDALEAAILTALGTGAPGKDGAT